jgi:hypothetical protein
VDVAILKVPLNVEEWKIDNGRITREHVKWSQEQHFLRSSNRTKRLSVKAEEGVRAEVPHGTTVMKIPKCSISTPSLTEKVFIFGFPGYHPFQNNHCSDSYVKYQYPCIYND